MSKTTKPSSTSSDSAIVNDHKEETRSADLEDRHGVPLYNAHVDISGVDERKLIRKIDFALIPWLSFLYLLSFLDRTSIGNAKVCIATMKKDGYSIFEVPSNVFLKRLRPSVWLSLLMLLWGVMMVRLSFIVRVNDSIRLTRGISSKTLQGVVHNFGGLMG
ncbi:hypothetical protein H0H81_006559 [Sphagnurus paluster]|uniref:Uncharacterized protein n=1 Tax=Sphagnurus paluster TaxID=117069 RepID=A0A9P7GWJ5_9AGAR|nr:hypothetical protein H0H81_006559 [Sphagnurus paluster]